MAATTIAPSSSNLFLNLNIDSPLVITSSKSNTYLPLKYQYSKLTSLGEIPHPPNFFSEFDEMTCIC